MTEAIEVDDAADSELPAPEGLRLVVSTVLAWLRPIWPWLVLILLGWLGWHELAQIDVSSVRQLLRATDVSWAPILLGATAFNLMVFGLYDVAAFGSRRNPPPLALRWSVGVVSFAWSNFLTLGPLAGPALRLWLYRSYGVPAKKATSALTSILVALGAGLLLWCAVFFLPLPTRSLVVRFALVLPIGALLAVALRRLSRLSIAPAAVRRWEGSQGFLVAVASGDWLIAWVVFHLSLTALDTGLDPGATLPAFFLGQLIGMLSFIPGGFGSADAYWLLSLSVAAGEHDRVLAALLLYRCVYYIIPWAIATLVLAGRLIRTGPRTSAFVRTAVASYTVLCGIVLLASAATPSLAPRTSILRNTLPLPLIEISHGVSVLLGFLLLVIARGLGRGYRSSHRLALALSLAAALTTFLKGLDFEEAILSLLAVAILIVVHRQFERAGRLAPPVEFIVSVGLFAVVFFAAVGFGSLPARPDVTHLLGRFGYVAFASRFLRGLILLASFVAVAALHFSLRSRVHDQLPDEAGIKGLLAEVGAHGRNTNPMLIACGDKAIFRSPPPAGAAPGPAGAQHGPAGAPSGSMGAVPGPGGAPPGPEGFIAYRTAGRFLVAYSDPVCPVGAERDVLGAFLDHAAALDREVILYQISPAFLPVAHDFGFTFFKLGEEATVDLARFDLKGNKAKSWRNALNSLDKAGGRFEIVGPDRIAPLMAELRRVSDDWLADKHIVEKRFSIGRFDEPYLLRFPCAVVRDAGGRIAGFANLLEGPRGEELSVDLMRYSARREEAGGLHNVMDCLFLHLMLYGKERGFQRFNLGMAPLAAVGQERSARPFERLAHLIFRHGEHWYNYQGLRRYKEKFDPVWEPRYMAYRRPWDWPAASTTTAVLIAGGWRALLFPTGESS